MELNKSRWEELADVVIDSVVKHIKEEYTFDDTERLYDDVIKELIKIYQNE